MIYYIYRIMIEEAYLQDPNDPSIQEYEIYSNVFSIIVVYFRNLGWMFILLFVFNLYNETVNQRKFGPRFECIACLIAVIFPLYQSIYSIIQFENIAFQSAVGLVIRHVLTESYGVVVFLLETGYFLRTMY